ncbi:hypothetical protein K5I29_02385 [Flavobacterium agricola]|uniref:Uncharacterized protein n=1 Tax=Flavobacterium agricola TaxID=2870839 RepID=A0ABY6LZQ1_9FLAO|nr:hypothetical protein [Flavobacterium agricola]UYW01792.1 hypothetical protein K5I29_02385 [Flavobacterium agricola]
MKVDECPVAFSYGNYDALMKWLVAKNKNQIEHFLPNPKASEKKYPLIWLTDEWQGNEHVPGYRFSNVTFYLACNSKIELLNENREGNFEGLYTLANQFIKELRKYGRIEGESISYQERANLTVTSGKKTEAIDIWDALIVKMDYLIFTNCIKKLCSQ